MEIIRNVMEILRILMVILFLMSSKITLTHCNSSQLCLLIMVAELILKVIRQSKKKKKK